MKIGILPFWLFAAVIASFAGVATDLAIAGAAIGAGLNVAFVTRNLGAVSAAIAPLGIIVLRYLILPAPGNPMTMYPGIVQFVTSWLSLVVMSSLSLACTYILGLRWVYAGPQDEKPN